MAEAGRERREKVGQCCEAGWRLRLDSKREAEAEAEAGFPLRSWWRLRLGSKREEEEEEERERE